MKKTNLAIVFVLALSLVLTACSSGGSSNGTSSSIDVQMTDFKFTPDTWTVDAGKEVTINLSNNGAVSHDWSLMIKPVAGSFSSANEADVVAKFDLEAGKTESVKFTAPTTAGEYQVICAIPGHLEAGMVGKLIVK